LKETVSQQYGFLVKDVRTLLIWCTISRCALTTETRMLTSYGRIYDQSNWLRNLKRLSQCWWGSATCRTRRTMTVFTRHHPRTWSSSKIIFTVVPQCLTPISILTS
jgi:hypothetical protein